MADIKNKEARSQNMAAIKSKNTKPEQFIRHELFMRGFRYRNNVSYIPGHPDLYLAKYRTAVFINGCFWHRHRNCKYAYMPKSNVSFWNTKFKANMKRDELVRSQLLDQNIKCLDIWECSIKKAARYSENRDDLFKSIIDFLKDTRSYLEL